MAMEKKKKVSERTTEIIPKKKQKMSSFNKFFIASSVVIATAGVIGTAKGIADIPVNIQHEEHTMVEKPANGKKNGKENGIEKFAGMKQEELDKAMLDAANAGNAEEIELLIRAGAEMDTRTSLGWTPLMITSQNIMSDDSALLLISSSANLDAKNDRGMTALMIAAMSGRTTIVEALIEGGADKDATDNRGRTAYDIAVEYQWKLTTELLKNGAGND